MHVKFSEDVVPLSDLKINPGKVVNRAQDTHRPILLTSRGRGVAVIQGLEGYIIVDTDEVLLICKKEEEQQIRQYVTDVKIDFGDRYV